MTFLHCWTSSLCINGVSLRERFLHKIFSNSNVENWEIISIQERKIRCFWNTREMNFSIAYFITTLIFKIRIMSGQRAIKICISVAICEFKPQEFLTNLNLFSVDKLNLNKIRSNSILFAFLLETILLRKCQKWSNNLEIFYLNQNIVYNGNLSLKRLYWFMYK